MRKFLTILISFIFVTILVSCGNSSSKTTLHSGQSITLSQDVPVCSSKENVDKMMNFVKEKNSNGQNQMLVKGEAKILSKGTTINVISISPTLIVEAETTDGEKCFAPDTAFK